MVLFVLTNLNYDEYIVIKSNVFVKKLKDKQQIHHDEKQSAESKNQEEEFDSTH
jgi:hypothetical protein